MFQIFDLKNTLIDALYNKGEVCVVVVVCIPLCYIAVVCELVMDLSFCFPCNMYDVLTSPYFLGYAVALDMTAREIQASAMVDSHFSLVPIDIFRIAHTHSFHFPC